MFTQLLQYNDFGLFLLRLVIAIIFLYHGVPKLKNPKAMAQGIGWKKEAVFILGLVEVLSPIALILGVYMQLAALLLAIIMVGAIKMKAMKWGVPFAAHDKNGWEFDLILLAANVVIILGGGGLIGIW